MGADFEQRKNDFEERYNQLVQDTGVTFQVDAVHRRVGPQHQIEPVLSIVPVAGWQAPVVEEVGSNGNKPDTQGNNEDD